MDGLSRFFRFLLSHVALQKRYFPSFASSVFLSPAPLLLQHNYIATRLSLYIEEKQHEI